MKASRNISNSMFMRKRRPSFFTSTASLFPPPLWGRVREGGDPDSPCLLLTPPSPPPPPSAPPCGGGSGRAVIRIRRVCCLPPSRRPSVADLPHKGGGNLWQPTRNNSKTSETRNYWQPS